jgi:hypothetical protein
MLGPRLEVLSGMVIAVSKERCHSLLLSFVGFSLAIFIKTQVLQENRVIPTLA